MFIFLKGRYEKNHVCRNTRSPKPKDIQFTMKYDKEKQQVLYFKELEPENICHFFTIFASKRPILTFQF